MAAITANVEQVIELARKLTPQEQARVAMALSRDTVLRLWQEVQTEGTQRMREIAADRGLTWDLMSPTDREQLVEALFHAGE